MKANASENTLESRLSEAKKASEAWPSAKRESMMAFVAGSSRRSSDSTGDSGASASEPDGETRSA